MTRHISIGDKVKHIVPSMLYNQIGIVTKEAGSKYGHRYVSVRYLNPHTNNAQQTDFWTQVLITQ